MKSKERLLKVFRVKKTHSFEAITNYLKTFLKSIKEVENMNLKNKTLLGVWISMASKVFRRDKSMGKKNLLGRFEDCLYKKCKI